MLYEIETRYVTYANLNGTDLKLCLYLPKGKQECPALLDIHGGGWVFLDDRSDYIICRELARHGIAVAAVNFRQGVQYPWPHVMQDLQAALHWLVAHSKELGINPQRIGVIGNSSGGHLATVLGLQPNNKDWATTKNSLQERQINIACIIGLYPIYDVVARYALVKNTRFSPLIEKLKARIIKRIEARYTDAQGNPILNVAGLPGPAISTADTVARLQRLDRLHNRFGFFGSLLLWGLQRMLAIITGLALVRGIIYQGLTQIHEAVFKDEKTMQTASPQYLLENDLYEALPPLLAIAPAYDPNVPSAQQQQFIELYKQKGGQAELITVPGVGHGYANISSPQSNHCIKLIDDFVDSVMSDAMSLDENLITTSQT